MGSNANGKDHNGVSNKILQLQEEALAELKPKQREKVKELRTRVNDILDKDVKEYFVLKFLRARNFDVSAAEAMLRANHKWRQANRVDYIMKEFISPEVLLKYYPHSFFGFDKEGSPLWIMKQGDIDIKGLLYSVSKADFLKHTITLLEFNDEKCKEQTEKRGELVEKVVTIMDLENFDIRVALWKPCYDLLISYLKIYEANYPESLKIGFIVNAPRVFSFFYNMVKPFLNEETRKKIKIYGKTGWKEELLKFVDADQLPVHWGGNAVDEVDGNPYCSSKVCIGGPVPESYYVINFDKMLEELDMETKTISPKGTFTIDYDIVDVNSTINWTFKTEQHDVGFGVTFSNSPSGEKIKEKKQYLIPIERVNSQLVPEDGSLVCAKAGRYSLVFDNSFSWYRGKKLLYNIRVDPPEAMNEKPE